LPEHRPALLEILQTLDGLPLAAVHLDIEPEQLEDNRTLSERARLLLETLQSAQQVTDLPVGLSIHPRYLDEKAVGFGMGALLASLDPYEVAVMLYGVPPERCAEKMKAWRKRWPRLPLSLAVSVEPSFRQRAGTDRLPTFIHYFRHDPETAKIPVLIQDYAHWSRRKP
jgi:hypothetical protein